MNDIDIKDYIRGVLPKDASPIGNHTVIRELQSSKGIELSREEYYRIRQQLIDNGEVLPVKGGYGGRVRRVKPVESVVEIQANETPQGWWDTERNLYQPFANFLKYYWPQNNNIFLQPDPIIQVIGDTHSPRDRSWSVSDVAVVDLIKYRWLPQREIEVHSFELKTAKGAKPTDAFQALSHGNFAHYTTLVWHTAGMAEHKISEVEQNCQDHNVGFISFEDPVNYDSYNVRHIPIKRSPPLLAVDEFIDLRMSNEHKTRLSLWLKGEGV